MDSATVVARFWNPFTGGYTVAKTRRRSFPISCKLPFKFTGFYQSDRRGVLSTRILRAKETEFTFPPEYYDDEWQAKQRKKTKELRRQRKEEEAEEEKKREEYREIGSRFRGYPEKEVKNAKLLVSSFIKSGEDVEEMIVEAAEKGELTELVLLVIWNRLEVARHDHERDAIQALDLLYRRVETEMLKRNSSSAMQLLNELLNLHNGFNDDEWLQRCRTCMLNIFPREDPFTIFVRPGTNPFEGPIDLPQEDDDILFRIDFIRETDALLQELKGEEKSETVMGLDPQSIAISLKLQEKERTLQQVKALRDLAISLKW